MADRVYKPIKNPKGGGSLVGPGPGRPKGSGKQKFRDHAEAALEVIVTLMARARSDKVRLDAARYLLDQAYGKALQSMELTGAEFVGQLTDKIRAADPVLAEQLAALQEKVGVELQ